MCWRSAGQVRGRTTPETKQGHPAMEEQVLLLLEVFEVINIQQVYFISIFRHLRGCEGPAGPPAGSTGASVTRCKLIRQRAALQQVDATLLDRLNQQNVYHTLNVESNENGQQRQQCALESKVKH